MSWPDHIYVVGEDSIFIGDEKGIILIGQYGMTWAQFKSEPTAGKHFLVEIKPGEQLSAWTLTGGETYTYEKSYLYETITLADTTTERYRKALVDIKENGISLTERSSIATVEANAGSWWHDTSNEKVYVHPSGSDAPINYILVGYFWLYLATDGLVLDSKYYEPYVLEKGLPSLKISNPDVYWGINEISGGTLKLANGRGFFDQISKKWLWKNKTCRLLMGGEDLAYSQYQLLRTLIIVDKSFQRGTSSTFSLVLRPKAHDFYRKVPLEIFTTDVYSSMDPDLEGQPIPIVYGLCHSHEAVPAFCTAQSLGSDQYQMTLADHKVHSYMQAYINYGAEAGWQTLAMDSSSLDNASFIFTSGSYRPGGADVKVALVGVESGGSYLSSPPHIMEHFLTTYCDVATSDISSSHLATSLNRTEVTLSVPIIEEIEAIDVIDKICRSDLAFFDEDETGKFRYRTWIPYTQTSYDLVDEKDVLGYTVDDATDQLFYQAKVGYRYDPIEDEHLYCTEVYSAGKFLYDEVQTLTHDTYINDSSGAARLAQRLMLQLRTPSPQGKFKLKTAIIDKLLGDQIRMTLTRAPYDVAGGYSERIFELSRFDLSFFPVQTTLRAFDLKEAGLNIGYWTNTDVSSYGGSTEEQRATMGFWCDADGYADPTDEDSLNTSVWW